jgi:quercetin dioxygenase-like cupin family protein
MRRIPARGLAIVLAVLILGIIPLVNAQEATPPSPPPDWSGIVEIVSVTPLEGSTFDLVLLRVQLDPGASTGLIENDQTRMLNVVQGQIEFRPQGGVGQASTLKAGDTLAISNTTTYEYENTGDDTALIFVSAFVPAGALQAEATPPAFPSATPAAAPTPHGGPGGGAVPGGCGSGCSHP